MTVQFNSPYVTLLDANGVVVVGGSVEFYTAGTLTPTDVYTDSELLIPFDPEDIVSDAAGRLPRIFMAPGQYRVIEKYSDGTTIKDTDDVDPGLSSAIGNGSALPIEQGGTGAVTAAAARTNLGVPSQAQLTSLANTVATNTAEITTGLNVSDPTRFGLLAKADAVTTALLVASFGDIRLQKIRLETLSNTTTNVTTPAYDTSIPQISEGTLVFTQAFTPKSTASKIRIRSRITGDQATNNALVTMGLFVDATAGAVAGDGFNASALAAPYQGVIEYETTNASLTLRTYTIRVGVSAGTFTFNGSTGSLGGVRKSYLEIEEWLTV